MHLRSFVLGAVLGGAVVAAGVSLPSCSKSKATPTKGDGPSEPGAPPQSQAELDAPIAKIDDVVITVRDFQDRINRQSPYIRARYNSTEQKKEFLDTLVRYEVLAKEAEKRGLDKDPDAVRAFKTVMIQKLMKAEFEDKIKPEDIPEADLKAYFDGHPEEFNKPEEVRVSAIILKSKKQAADVATSALGEEGQSNKGFRDLVEKYSTDETTKTRGGDLQYFSHDSKDLPPEVIDGAFGLDVTGKVAGPIAGNDGRFYILKQTGRRRAIVKTYDQVKRQIQNQLWKDKRTEAQKQFIETLRQQAKVEVFDANLKKVRIESAQASGHGHGGENLPALVGGEGAGSPEALPTGGPGPAPEGSPTPTPAAGQPEPHTGE